MKKARLSIDLSQAERQALKHLAVDRGVSVKTLVVEALEYRYPAIITHQGTRHAKPR